jgi:hypothetical protein
LVGLLIIIGLRNFARVYSLFGNQVDIQNKNIVDGLVSQIVEE